MFPDTSSPSLSTTTTQSWTQGSTIDIDDAQPQTLSDSDAPGSSTVFEEKKWIVSEVGDSGTPFFFPFVSLIDRSRSSQSGEFCVQANAFASMSSHLTKRRYRRPFLSFFFSSSDRTGVSRRMALFSTLTSIPVRRQREVCASFANHRFTALPNPDVSRIASSRIALHLAPLTSFQPTRVGG